MTCPVCCGETKVIYTRDNNDNITRFRRCQVCNYGFRTIETDEDIYQRLKKGNKEENEN